MITKTRTAPGTVNASWTSWTRSSRDADAAFTHAIPGAKGRFADYRVENVSISTEPETREGRMPTPLAFFVFAAVASAGGVLILLNWRNLTLLLRVHYGRIYGKGFAKLITFPATIVFGIVVLLAAVYAIAVGVYYLP